MAKYDGVLRRPFLLEHWHKGIAAAFAILLPTFSLASYAGLDLVAAAWVAALIGVTVSFSVCTHYEGFALDTHLQCYRGYIWIIGLCFGKWQRLPSVARILVRPYNHPHYLPMTDGRPVKLGFRATEQKWQGLLGVTASSIGIIAAYLEQKRSITYCNFFRHAAERRS